jgi:3-oxoacyl-[acyl-carrier-protein] synthase II
VVLTGVGLITPAGYGDAAVEALQNGEMLTQRPAAIDHATLAELLQARRVRRMSDYVKLSLAATRLALDDAALDDAALTDPRTGALLGTAHGSADYCARYYHQLVAEGSKRPMPCFSPKGSPTPGRPT